ncbi:hypothetical protein IAT38_000407 [Cryptococcus sp. DSM 104549]
MFSLRRSEKSVKQSKEAKGPERKHGRVKGLLKALCLPNPAHYDTNDSRPPPSTSTITTTTTISTTPTPTATSNTPPTLPLPTLCTSPLLPILSLPVEANEHAHYVPSPQTRDHVGESRYTVAETTLRRQLHAMSKKLFKAENRAVDAEQALIQERAERMRVEDECVELRNERDELEAQLASALSKAAVAEQAAVDSQAQIDALLKKSSEEEAALMGKIERLQVEVREGREVAIAAAKRALVAEERVKALEEELGEFKVPATRHDSPVEIAKVAERKRIEEGKEVDKAEELPFKILADAPFQSEGAERELESSAGQVEMESHQEQTPGVVNGLVAEYANDEKERDAGMTDAEKKFAIAAYQRTQQEMRRVSPPGIRPLKLAGSGRRSMLVEAVEGDEAATMAESPTQDQAGIVKDALDQRDAAEVRAQSLHRRVQQLIRTLAEYKIAEERRLCEAEEERLRTIMECFEESLLQDAYGAWCVKTAKEDRRKQEFSFARFWNEGEKGSKPMRPGKVSGIAPSASTSDLSWASAYVHPSRQALDQPLTTIPALAPEHEGFAPLRAPPPPPPPPPPPKVPSTTPKRPPPPPPWKAALLKVDSTRIAASRAMQSVRKLINAELLKYGAAAPYQADERTLVAVEEAMEKMYSLAADLERSHEALIASYEWDGPPEIHAEFSWAMEEVDYIHEARRELLKKGHSTNKLFEQLCVVVEAADAKDAGAGKEGVGEDVGGSDLPPALAAMERTMAAKRASMAKGEGVQMLSGGLRRTLRATSETVGTTSTNTSPDGPTLTPRANQLKPRKLIFPDAPTPPLQSSSDLVLNTSSPWGAHVNLKRPPTPLSASPVILTPSTPLFEPLRPVRQVAEPPLATSTPGSATTIPHPVSQLRRVSRSTLADTPTQGVKVGSLRGGLRPVTKKASTLRVCEGATMYVEMDQEELWAKLAARRRVVEGKRLGGGAVAGRVEHRDALGARPGGGEADQKAKVQVDLVGPRVLGKITNNIDTNVRRDAGGSLRGEDEPQETLKEEAVHEGAGETGVAAGEEKDGEDTAVIVVEPQAFHDHNTNNMTAATLLVEVQIQKEKGVATPGGAGEVRAQ